MASKRKKMYWTDVQENLIKKILEETNLIERERLLIKLRPALRHMSEIILRKYYNSYYHQGNEREHIYDGINYLWTRLNKFNPNRGNGFTFCGTVIKRYFHDKFVTVKKRLGDKKLDEAIRNNNNSQIISDDANHDYVSYPDLDFEDENVIEKVKEKLESLYKKYKRSAGSRHERKLEFLIIMINLLDNFTTYERFIIDLHKEYGNEAITNIRTMFHAFGFDSKYVTSSVKSYLDQYKEEPKALTLIKDHWMDDDYTPITTGQIKSKMRKKILDSL